ncbi:MAG: bL17 family ribosomal protein, partial [Duncaniella sp.]|nr:bL17 family ribosomal protein [Duncaniella sp.]
KQASTPNRRLVFSELQNKEAVNELFREISQKIANRPGGYTRILKTGNRLGDNAKMCFIELVDYNELMLDDKAAAKKSTRTRRSRKSSKPAAEAPAAEAPATEAPAAE